LEEKKKKKRLSSDSITASKQREKDLDAQIAAADSVTNSDTSDYERRKKQLEEEKKQVQDSISRIKQPSSSIGETVSTAMLELEREKQRLLIILEDTNMDELTRERDTYKSIANKRQFGLDICIMMDCTGSMSSWIAQAKSKVVEIMVKSKDIDKRIIPRIAFVGYRDHGDGAQQFSIIDFNENGTEIESGLAGVVATGGGDAPEDIAGAFKKVLGLNWFGNTRIVIHIADAPCHGTKYHNCKDSYPEGDPNGLVPELLLRKMCDRSMKYHFVSINNTTDKMIEIFKKVYEAAGMQIMVDTIGDDASKFLPTVLDSIKESVNRSIDFK